MVAMKLLNELLVDDKITACVRQLYVKFRKENHCLVGHFALKNVCYQYFNFELQVTLFSYELSYTLY